MQWSGEQFLSDCTSGTIDIEPKGNNSHLKRKEFYLICVLLVFDVSGEQYCTLQFAFYSGEMVFSGTTVLLRTYLRYYNIRATLGFPKKLIITGFVFGLTVLLVGFGALIKETDISFQIILSSIL